MMPVSSEEMERRVGEIERNLATWRRDEATTPIRQATSGGGAIGLVSFAVAREIGTGDEPYIMVQRLRQISASPGWAYASATVERAATIGDWTAGEYASFLCTVPGDWVPNVRCPIILLVRGNLSPVAWPWSTPEMVNIDELDNVPRTDAFPQTPGEGRSTVSAPLEGDSEGLIPADLDDLADVTLPEGLADNDLLAWNAATEQWINQTREEAEVASRAILNRLGSSGWISGGAVTDAGGNTINVAAGWGLFRPADDETADLKLLPWSLASGLSVPVDTTRFVGVEYNGGSPQVIITDTEDDFDSTTTWQLAVIVNEDGTIHVDDHRLSALNHAHHTLHMLEEVFHVQRAEHRGGLILGEIGTRNVTVTEGVLFVQILRNPIAAIDTSDASTMDRYYRDNPSGFVKEAAETQWPNEEYDDGSGSLVTMTNNRWSNLWFYLETDGALVMLYGQAQYVTEAQAEMEGPPSNIPDRLEEHGILIGVITFKKSAATGTVRSAFAATFSATGVTAHAQLATVTSDQHHTKDHAARHLDGGDDAISGLVTAPAVLANNAIVTGAGGAKDVQTRGVEIDASNNLLMPGTAELRFLSAAQRIYSLNVNQLNVVSTIIDLDGLVQVHDTGTLVMGGAAKTFYRESAQFIHSPSDNNLTIAGPDILLDGDVRVTGAFGIPDTGADHHLLLASGENLSADRVLSLVTGDADRTLSLNNSIKLNQNLETTDSPTFQSVTIAGNLIHAGDADTKLGFAPNLIGLEAGGVSGIELSATLLKINKASADLDFSVDGLGARDLLNCDAGNATVTIGGNVSLALFNVSGNMSIKEEITFKEGPSIGSIVTDTLKIDAADVIELIAPATKITGWLQHEGDELGLFGVSSITRPDVTGARDNPEEAFSELLKKLENLGAITDSTTPS